MKKKGRNVEAVTEKIKSKNKHGKLNSVTLDKTVNKAIEKLKIKGKRNHY